MAKFISKAVQNMHTANQQDKYIDKVEKNNFFDKYKKETNKNKKIEMLRMATQEGWL